MFFLYIYNVEAKLYKGEGQGKNTENKWWTRS